MKRKVAGLTVVVAIGAIALLHEALAASTYYFACKHQSEGFGGLTGPSRLTYAMAQQDADSLAPF
jgi:hypothetical protein